MVVLAYIPQKQEHPRSSRAACLHKQVLSGVFNIVRSNWVPDNKEAAKSLTDDVQTTIKQSEQRRFYDTKRYPWPKRYARLGNMSPTNIRWTAKRSGYSSRQRIARKYDPFSMSRLRKYDDVVWNPVAKWKRPSVAPASSSRHARDAPDSGLLRPQRGAWNRLGDSFFISSSSSSVSFLATLSCKWLRSYLGRRYR